MKVANLFFFVGLRVRLVSGISPGRGMCPDRNTARRPRSSREAPLRTHASMVPGARTVSAAVRPTELDSTRPKSTSTLDAARLVAFSATANRWHLGPEWPECNEHLTTERRCWRAIPGQQGIAVLVDPDVGEYRVGDCGVSVPNIRDVCVVILQARRLCVAGLPIAVGQPTGSRDRCRLIAALRGSMHCANNDARPRADV